MVREVIIQHDPPKKKELSWTVVAEDLFGLMFKQMMEVPPTFSNVSKTKLPRGQHDSVIIGNEHPFEDPFEDQLKNIMEDRRRLKEVLAKRMDSKPTVNNARIQMDDIL